jgi:hypothetical protein
MLHILCLKHLSSNIQNTAGHTSQKLRAGEGEPELKPERTFETAQQKKDDIF